MLFTDHDLVTRAAIEAIDADVPNIAKLEIKLLEGDGSILRQAAEEVAHWITARIQTFSGYYGSAGLTANHLAVVLNTGGGPVSVPAVRLSNVIVDSQYGAFASEIQRFAQYSALYLLFRAAWNRKVEDRYQRKMERYEEDMAKARARLEDNGLPIVLAPLPCPGAIHEVGSGEWNEARNLSQVAGAGVFAGNVQILITYTGSAYVSPSAKGNAESGPSKVLEVGLTNGNVLRIDITSLTPPSGAMPAVGTAQGTTAYMAATGWNVYVGMSGNAPTLQNASPIPIATKTYTLAADPTTTGAVVGSGQFPDHHYHFGGKKLMRA